MSRLLDKKQKEIDRLRTRYSKVKSELDEIIDQIIRSLPVTDGDSRRDPGSKLPLDSVREFEDYDKGDGVDFVLGTIYMRQSLRKQKDEKTEELDVLSNKIRAATLDLILEQTKDLESSLGESEDGYREV